jgi:two-component system, NtrC family, sensor histidine kinase HydH
MRTRWIVVVVAVFLASLATLVASTALALWNSTDEYVARDRLRAAAAALAEASREVVSGLSSDEPGSILSESENRRLAEIARHVLTDYPQVEGGFYLVRSNQFAGAMMTGKEPVNLPNDKDVKGARKDIDKKSDKKKSDKKAAERKEAVEVGRREPPPMETDSIRQQCLDAANAEPGSLPIVDVRDIGPSRVAVATMAVGEDHPARVAIWVMIRLTGPEQQKAHLARLQMATGLSLGGILLALTLAAALAGSLRRESNRRAILRDELRRAEHLAALGRLLAGVAHEVRNPLAAIRSTVQLWERLPDETCRPESLTAVIAAVDRLNELVSRLLLFARAGHESHRLVDLNAVVAETLELVRARADTQSVRIETDLALKLPAVADTARALGQVVLNLVTNALQVMPAGGRLTCSTLVLPGGRLELTVSDTGPGVPSEARDHIFEPFFTTRSDGTGLGLALCREIAHQHGGAVTLDPTTDGGATFRLILPATGDAP